MPRVALALERPLEPEELINALKDLASMLSKRGCKIATPAPGSWMLAACGSTLLTVYPSPLDRQPPTLIDANISITLHIEGDAESIVELVAVILAIAQRRRIRVKPLLI